MNLTTIEKAAKLLGLNYTMQGDASAPSGYTDVETINRWHRLRGTDYEVVERGYLPFSSKPFKTDETDCTTAVWLSPPPSAASKIAEQDAEIAKLQKELEEARKGLMTIETLMQDSEGVAGLHLNGDVAPWHELRTGGRFESWLLDFDAAISKIGGGE